MDTLTIVWVLLGIVAVCIIMYRFYLASVGETGPQVPPGYVAFGKRSHAVKEEGRHYNPKLDQLIDIHEQVTDLSSFEGTPGENGKRFKTLVTWKPDLRNLRNYESPEKVHFELKRLYATLPTLDLLHYAKVLGIQVMKVEDNQKPSKITGVSIGEGVEIPY